MKNGIKEWTLNASSADYFEEQKKINFKNPDVTLFLDDGKKVMLKAEQGVLFTDSNDIEVEGDVIVTHKNYRLLADKIFYDNTKRIIFSKTHVKIMGDSFNLEADSMSHDLKTDRAFFEGMVTGVLSEKITF